MKKSGKILLTSLFLVLLTMVSCTHSKPSPGTDLYTGSEGYNRADSIVSDIGDTRNHKRVLEVIDSLEKAGELPLVRTIFYRTISYNLMGQYNTSLRLYAQLAGINPKQLNTQADLDCYIYSYNNYVRVLCEMRRYDRALREANAVDRKLKSIGYNGFTDHHDIAQIMGESSYTWDKPNWLPRVSRSRCKASTHAWPPITTHWIIANAKRPCMPLSRLIC